MKGKAKIDFEQWYKQFYAHNLPNKNRYEEDFEKDPNWKRLAITIFYSKIPQEQQGVLLQFFRERGIFISQDDNAHNKTFLLTVCKNGSQMFDTIIDPDYHTAFTHAIDKACEIYGGEG